jgi:hypothetical protein
MKAKRIILLLILTLSISMNSIMNWSQLSMNYFLTKADDDIDIITGATQNATNVNTKPKFGLQ